MNHLDQLFPWQKQFSFVYRFDNHDLTLPYCWGNLRLMIQITSNNLPADFWNCMKESFSKYLDKQVDFNFNIKGISDIHIESDYRSKPKILPGKFNVLILWEPKAVNPWSYQKKVINKFQLVIACGQQRSQNLHINDFILHPYNFENQLIDESNREKNFVIIKRNTKSPFFFIIRGNVRNGIW